MNHPYVLSVEIINQTAVSMLKCDKWVNFLSKMPLVRPAGIHESTLWMTNRSAWHSALIAYVNFSLKAFIDAENIEIWTILKFIKYPLFGMPVWPLKKTLQPTSCMKQCDPKNINWWENVPIQPIYLNK